MEICGSFTKLLFKNVSVTLKIVFKKLDIRPEDVSTEHNRRVFSNRFHMCVKSSVTVTGSDTEVSEDSVNLFDSLRILELRLETEGE